MRVRVSGGDTPTVEVADDGPGIAADDLPHIFERLYQANRRPLRKETGSGLGLAIVHELVGAMGGTVEAHSALGLGTRMVVALPRPNGAALSGHERQGADLGGDGTAGDGDLDGGTGLDGARQGGEGDRTEPG